MEAGRGAGLVKLLVFLSLCYVISGSNAGKQGSIGCLFVDIMDTPDCFSLPVGQQKQCPSINYKVVDFPSNPVLIKTSLARVKAIQNMLNLISNAIKATKECKKAVRKYVCSNMFGECIKVAGSSVMVKYKSTETKKACDKVKSVCPQSIQDATIYNCTNIMSNPLEFLQCASLPDVVGDVCPKTNYKYPLPSVREYPGLAKTSKNVFAQMQRTAGNMSLDCAQKIMSVTCQLNAGPICSNDLKLRMYAMCKQDCEDIMKKCLPGQKMFKQLCKLFPDKKTAKKVAIPVVASVVLKKPAHG